MYTVGSNKAARVRILFMVEGATGGQWRFNLRIGSPGTENHVHSLVPANSDLWSGVNDSVGYGDASLSFTHARMGMQEEDGALDIDSLGAAGTWWASPLQSDYYLNAGDVVQVSISTENIVDILVQVYGVEDDA